MVNAAVFHRIKHLNTFAHQLHHVFVRTDDCHTPTGALGLCRQRRNDIVGLKPFEFLARDIKRFCGTAGERHLRPQIFGHGVAVGFILVI